MTVADVSQVGVEASRCIRCAACAILAPGVFEVRQRVRVSRQPTVDEAAACEAAALVCPTRSIHLSNWPTERAPAEPGHPRGPIRDLIGEAAAIPLFDHAEAVRWRMADIPWAKIDAAQAPPDLRALMRLVAASELTTFAATKRFMADFADDADLTQWLAVWFYEESKHSQVLLRWLHQLGERVDETFVLRGRATAPFMRSRMGTLVTNVISEMVAAASYQRLAALSAEPVLATIGERLSADEGRHAASFFTYAQRLLARTTTPTADRRDAIKVLYLWFQGNELVSHPVNEFFARHDVDFDLAAVRDRVFRLIGLLVGDAIDGASDLLAVLRNLGGDS